MVTWMILRAVGTFVGEKTHRWEKRAEEILDERFARGELTEEEYRRMKKLLRNR
ncbi:MAG: SHOCT domain-containing protein [Thermotogae bacterium]|nr:SHOCT domain-containing protein [Thermotogota bacterium]